MISHGSCYPPCRAEKQTATLTLLPDGQVHFVSGECVQTLPLAEITISPPLGNVPMKVTLPDGTLFIPADAASLSHAFAGHVHGRSGRRLHRLERHTPMIGVSVVVTVLLCVAFFTHGIPWLSRALVVVVPTPIAQHVGEQVLDTLDTHFLSPSTLSVEEQQAVSAQFDALQAALGPFPMPPRLLFRSWDQGPNAMALSDGTVIVLDSLVTMAETPEQLAGILLHELGHVQHEHVMVALVRSALLSVTMMAITGESGGVIDTFSGAGVFVISQGFSRSAEEEADAYAAEHMQQLYGSVAPMQSMFQALLDSAEDDEDEAIPQWLSTHPGLAERIEALSGHVVSGE